MIDKGNDGVMVSGENSELSVNIAVILPTEESGQLLEQAYNGHDSYMFEMVARNDECEY